MSSLRCTALVLMLICSLFAPTGLAETIDVNSTDDLPDANIGDGVCDADLETEGLQCTLRAAIMHANFTPGADEINLPAGLYRLKLKDLTGPVDGGDPAATGDLDISDDVTITGAGADETIIDGKKAKTRIFDIFAPTTIESLQVRKGNVKSETDGDGGGGIRANDDLTLSKVLVTKNRCLDDGGGLRVESGTTTVQDSMFTKNRAKDDGGGIDISGGELVMNNSTLSRNKASDEGGAFENSAQNTTFTNVTMAFNRAKNNGAAMSLEDASVTTLINCTLAKNRSKEDANISADDDDGGANTVNLTNTLLFRVGKKKANCVGPISSGGGNLENGDSCGFLIVDGTFDLSNTDPRLDKKLRDNGGNTETMALRDDSPAIDAADDGACPEFDQRGNARVDIDGVGTTVCDIGAFEYTPVIEN